MEENLAVKNFSEFGKSVKICQSFFRQLSRLSCQQFCSMLAHCNESDWCPVKLHSANFLSANIPIVGFAKIFYCQVFLPYGSVYMYRNDCFIVTLCNNLSHLVCNSFSKFSPFISNKGSKRREHGAVDESSLEQHIHESDNHTLIVRKNWSPSTRGTRSYVSQVGRPSDKNLVVLEIFKIDLLDSRQLFRLFQSIFSLGKVVPIHLWTIFCGSIVWRLLLRRCIFMEAILSTLLLSTTVLNDRGNSQWIWQMCNSLSLQFLLLYTCTAMHRFVQVLLIVVQSLSTIGVELIIRNHITCVMWITMTEPNRFRWSGQPH